MRVVEFSVLGTPIPKGSTRSFLHKSSGRVVTMNANAKSKPWMACVASAARDVLEGDEAGPWTGMASVRAVFAMPRPKAHYGTKGLKANAPTHQTTKPDIDKLVRCVLDALTGVAWRDDSQVVEVVATKRYVFEDEPAGCLVTLAMEA